MCVFNQEKALVGTASVIANLRVDPRFKLYYLHILNVDNRMWSVWLVRDGAASCY